MNRDTIIKKGGLYPKLTIDDAIQFLDGAANYFANRPTEGEDRAYWANVANSERCKAIRDWLISETKEE